MVQFEGNLSDHVDLKKILLMAFKTLANQL